jgi:hypothetical protein
MGGVASNRSCHTVAETEHSAILQNAGGRQLRSGGLPLLIRHETFCSSSSKPVGYSG